MSIIKKSENNIKMEEVTEIAKSKKLTNEELEQINFLNFSNQELIIEFGRVEFQLQHLLTKKQTLIDKLKQNESSEILLNNSLKEKYGNININVETGEITQL